MVTEKWIWNVEQFEWSQLFLLVHFLFFFHASAMAVILWLIWASTSSVICHYIILLCQQTKQCKVNV